MDVYREMVGDSMADAVVAAQTRTDDDTIIARCEETQWIVARGGKDLQGSLSHDGAIEYLGALK